MSADQTFSSVTDESGLCILQNRVEVPKVIKPKESKPSKVEAIKFDM